MIKQAVIIFIFCFFLYGCDIHYNSLEDYRWTVIEIVNYQGDEIRYMIRETRNGKKYNDDFWLYSKQKFELGDELIVVKKEK